MIISFKNLNGGGGSGYTLPIASQSTLGGIKVGSGLTIDPQNGILSAEGGQGGGIEVVSQLPASGTDGQMVMLVKSYEGSEEIIVRGTENGSSAVSVTAKSVTEDTKLLRYMLYTDGIDVSATTEGDIEIFSDYFQTGTTFSGDGSFILDATDYGFGTVEITVTKVADGEWLFESERAIDDYPFGVGDVHSDVIPPATEYKLYKWSDEETPSIDAVISNDNYMVELFYDQIPAYTESAFSIVKVSVMEGEPVTQFHYANGNFYEGETLLTADGQMHIGNWDNTSYLISDGYMKFISNNGAIKFVDRDIWNGQMNATGWTEYGRNGVVYNGKNCYVDFPIKFNGNAPIYGGYGISNVYVPTSLGNNGQILKTNGEGVYWDDPEKKQVGVYEVLPPFGAEDEIGIANSGVSYTPSSAWLALNTTDPEGKNNFNDYTNISHIGNGHYIYFDCNGELQSSTAKTFLYRIAMRTNENDDWNTSNIAYINVYREYDEVSHYHFYSWEMPPFVYKDDQGNDFTYSDSGTVDSSTTANTTEYLPLWRWWDGGYGYKFTFEYDNVADTLKVWLNHSDIDQIQGENYGYIEYRCQDHTKEFCEYTTDPNSSEVSVFKGGAWYRLNENVPQYAMALKNIKEGQEGNENFRVVNDGGWLYYVDESNEIENNPFVKVKYDADNVYADIDLNGHTDTDIIGIGNSVFDFTISIDENGELYYTDADDNVVTFDSATTEYHYGDFTFNWEDNGTHITFPQQADLTVISPLNSNYESWYLIAQDIYIANQDQLGLVKIGDNINLANDGTISVDSSEIRYVVSDNPTISGVYIKKDNEGAALCYDGAYGSFAIKYDQMFQSQEGEPVELANGNNFVDFRAKYDYVDDTIVLEYASSVDDFEEWTEAFDGDTIKITFGDRGAKAPVGTTFFGDVSIGNDLGVIKVSFNAEDGWTVDSVGSFISEWTKIADKNGNPLPKSFNGMLYNEEGKLQRGDGYLINNNLANNSVSDQITVDPPYTDIFGIEIGNIYLDADATILKTDYHKEENNQRKGTRSATPYVRIHRDRDNNLIFEVFDGQQPTEYTYDYEDGMSVGIDMDGYALVNGEQQDEIIEGGGMTLSNTFLFGQNESVNAKFEDFCIKQYDDVNDGYYDLWYYVKIKDNKEGMSCVLATENYDSIISCYSSDYNMKFEVFSNEENRISKLEQAIAELQNGGGGNNSGSTPNGTISIDAAQTDNTIDIIGSFTSATYNNVPVYNSIWASYISNTMYDDAINNNEDPEDLDWIISQGAQNQLVDGETISDMLTVDCDGYLKVYYFLYNSTNDIVCKTDYWTQTFNGDGNCGGGGGDEE